MASFTMKSAVSGTPLSQRAPLRPSLRTTSVVRASTDEQSRRAFLGFVAAGAAFVVGRDVEAIEIIDDRKNAARNTGYYLIDEARDGDLPQNTRDGLTQSRSDLPGTKARIAESIARLKRDVPVNIQRKYWVQAREELRRQLGTMRFDLDTIALSLGDSASKKAAKKASDSFFVVVEVLDDALRRKNQEEASKAFDNVVAAIGTLNIG